MATDICWAQVDTVLLDMDGTLLDLAFDNRFWSETVPAAWAAPRGLTLAEAQAELTPLFAAARGRLDWYCLDYWTRELELDIAGLKADAADGIRMLPGAADFLRRMSDSGRRLLMVTNAHPVTLEIKLRRTAIDVHFESLISTHQFGVPKEEPSFWRAFAEEHRVDLGRALFVDDGAHILRAALAAGVAQVVQILHPDSLQPPRPAGDLPAVNALGDLGP